MEKKWKMKWQLGNILGLYWRYIIGKMEKNMETTKGI